MSWSKINDEKFKLSFASKATEAVDIAKDIKIVIDEMIENRERDNAPEAKRETASETRRFGKLKFELQTLEKSSQPFLSIHLIT